MKNIFELTYNFFNKNSFLYYSLLLAIAILFYFTFSNIKFEEDITKMLPNSKKTEIFNEIISKSSFSDRIIFNVTSNKIASIEEDSLSIYADYIVSGLNNLLPKYINKINYTVDERFIQSVYEYFYNNLPYYLTETDYIIIDSISNKKSIKEGLENNYRTLISPAGFAFKNFILKDPLHLTPIVLKKLKEIQIDEDFELHNNRIYSKNKQHLIFYIEPSNKVGNTKENTLMFNKIDSIISNMESFFPNCKVEYFGSTAVSVSNANQIKLDIIITLLLAGILLFLIIIMYYRNALVILLIFLPIIFGSGVAISVFYLLFGKISSITIGIGSVLLGISIDYSIHLITHLKEKKSIIFAIKNVSFPLLIGCATTAMAFLGLTFLNSSLLKELGLFAAISVSFAAIFTLIFLPRLLKNVDFNRKSKNNKIEQVFSEISEYNFHKSKVFIFGTILILATSLFFINKVQFEEDMNKLSFMSPELINAEKNLDSINSYKLKSIYLISTGKDLNSAINNNNNSLLIIDSLKNINKIKKKYSVSNFLLSDSLIKIKLNNWNQFWDSSRVNKVINDINENASILGFKKGAFNNFFETINKKYSGKSFIEDSTFRELILKDYIIETNNLSSIVTILKVKNEDKAEVCEVLGRIENNLILDKQYITSSLIEILKKDFSLLVYISMIIVFIILTISFGRIELGIISFLPIFISWIITLGIMGIFGLKFNIINIIITTFVFGLGIDYSIFITKGMINKYKDNSEDIKSFKVSILLSFLTTIVGTGVLIFASHPALKSIAIVSIVGLTSTILMSYTVIPLLFTWITYSSGKRRASPISFQNLIYSIIALTIFFIGSIILTLFIILPIMGKKAKYLYHYILMLFSKFIIYIMFNVKKKIINEYKIKINKPYLIIVNHQSHIDIPLILMLNPKLIILTNDWVQNNIFYGIIVKFAEFYPVSDGYENSIDVLSEKVKDGYSIVVFPEGSRSIDNRIKRFHKGAFYIAEKLKLDILPILIHGTGDCMTKGEPFLKKGKIFLKYLPVIQADSNRFGITYQEKTKTICKYYRQEFYQLFNEYNTLEYLRKKLITAYLFKSPVLEWYLKVKIRLENDYKVFFNYIPDNFNVTDLGCGYGFLCYMLNLKSEKRLITGVDFDFEKINVANYNPLKNNNIKFYCADISEFKIINTDCFIISDVLHYLPFEKQKTVINNCLENLSYNGLLIIRDADTNLKKRHSRTILTEYFSIKFFGFNKTYNDTKELYFFNKDIVNEIIDISKYSIEVIDNSKFTSNIIYIIRNKNA